MADRIPAVSGWKSANRLSRWFRRMPGVVSIAAAILMITLLPDARTEDGVIEDRITFGQSAAFQGPAASLGMDFRNGINAAFSAANRAGGVHGRQLLLIGYDDGYEPERAIGNTNRLIEEDRVFALIGQVGTPTSRAVQPIAETHGVPFIGPFTGDAFLRDPAMTTIVNVRASYDQEAEALVAYLVSKLGFRRIAVLYQDDTFGRAGLAGTTQALRKRELKLVADGTYRRNTTAVKRALLTIRRARPQAVIIVGAYKPVATFIRTAEDIGFNAVFATLSFVGSRALASELKPVDATVLVSQVVPRFDDHDLPLVVRFRQELALSAPEAEAGFVALEGYIAGRLVIEALERLGPEPDRQGFLDLFNSPTAFDIDGFTLDYDAGDNQGSDQVFLTRIRPDGSFAAAGE